MTYIGGAKFRTPLPRVLRPVVASMPRIRSGSPSRRVDAPARRGFVLAYIARRLILSVFTIFVISVLSFFIMELPPGDAASKYIDRLMLSGEAFSMALGESLRKDMGLDKPVAQRYVFWIGNVMQGNLGHSYQYFCSSSPRQRLVKELISDRIWTTIALTGFTVIFTWSFAIPIGIYSAVRQHSIGDYVVTTLGFTGLAVPDFLLGLVLMYLAFAYLDQSVGGLFSGDFQDAPWDIARVWDLFKHLWIPAAVLGTSGTAGLIRVMRNNLLDELDKPYVVTARAKGVNALRIIIKYPVRVAINPLVSTVGYLLPHLISGSVIVSVVLSLPTLGPVLLDSVIQLDVQTAGFIILMLGILTVLGTLLSDILLAVVDPRIRFTGR
jgi:peptide/nickel transport system permease protein